MYKDKDNEYDKFGLRVHNHRPSRDSHACSENLSVAQLFWSILVPWHNDFLAIWIYLGFFVYFFVTLFLIAFHTPYYKMKYH